MILTKAINTNETNIDVYKVVAVDVKMSSHFPWITFVVTILSLLGLIWLVYSQIEWKSSSNLVNYNDDFNDNLVRVAQGLIEGKVLIEQATGRRVIFYQGFKFGKFDDYVFSPNTTLILKTAEANRFERAHFATPWTDVYQAKSPRVACPQLTFPLKPEQIIEPELETSLSDEDCLYMNIWQPKALEGEMENINKSVMFYIVGGGFNGGNIFKYAHDGQHLAAIGNVIVVSINYRLGPLGFLNLGYKHTNLGMHDIILALDWV